MSRQYIAKREGSEIFVRHARSDCKLRPGEIVVPDRLAVRFKLLLTEYGTTTPVKGYLYRELDKIVPDMSDDLSMIRAEAERLAKMFEAAIGETASKLKKRGVRQQKIVALLKYDILHRMDGVRRVRHLAHVRERGLSA